MPRALPDRWALPPCLRTQRHPCTQGPPFPLHTAGQQRQRPYWVMWPVLAVALPVGSWCLVDPLLADPPRLQEALPQPMVALPRLLVALP